MKNTRVVLSIAVLIAAFYFTSTSCNRANTQSFENQFLNIILADNLSGKYISTTYADYKPTKISKSNKTLNQYGVQFSCNERNFKKLKGLLSSDKNVTSFNNEKINNDKVQSGKNNQRAKTKPIRDKN